MHTKSVLLFISLLLGCWAQKKSYAGYKVIGTETVSKDTLKTLYDHTGQWDFLSGPMLGRSAQILVAPEELIEVQAALNSENITFQVVEEDVQRVLDENQKKVRSHVQEGLITFHQYISLPEINAYLDNLQEQYPKLVSVQIIGNSTEGRPIKVVKISSGGENKPAMFVDATIHAREWMVPCAAMYLINQLVENYTNNRDLVDKVDWYIIPVINVDGYEYSFTKDRMWRKTRSDVGNAVCRGVDANRNFPFYWEETLWDNVCFLGYSGKFPMSEPEVKALIKFATSIKDRIKLYITMHAFGPILAYPWGYTETPVEDKADLQSLGDKVVAAVKAASGADYACGPIADTVYKAPGNSVDWFKGELGVKYSYAIELNSGGYFSFFPPTSAILPIVIETFEVFKVFGEFLSSGGK